jgi:Peptide methionine sulfoxide reductase
MQCLLNYRTACFLGILSIASSFNAIDRRAFFRLVGAHSFWLAEANVAPPNEFLYIGCGCFWHLQHSVAVLERDQWGRKGSQLTCQTGYAGGTRAEKVCYHNNEGIMDYGELGHAEVVRVEAPSDKIMDLMQVYLDNFNANTKGEWSMNLPLKM